MSWEDGQRIFEELLLDADWALNAGNWMWASSSAFFYQYFRVYSPVTFGKKTDPHGYYIRKYCPELNDYPSDVIYEPWKTSISEQREYKCEIGKDYPKRIVIHEEVVSINKGYMKRAYELHNGDISHKVRFTEEVERPLAVVESKQRPMHCDTENIY